jgi:MFS family permease
MSVSLFATAAFLGTLFVVPLFLQDGKGVDPLTSGLSVFPEAIGVVTSTQVVARVYPKIGPRRLMTGGLILVALVLFALSALNFSVDLWLFRALMFGLGAGMACIFVSNQAAALADISREMTGRASMLYSVQRQIGAAVGVALLSTIMLSVGSRRTLPGGETTPDIAAYRAAFLVAAGLALGWYLFYRPIVNVAVQLPAPPPPPAPPGPDQKEVKALQDQIDKQKAANKQIEEQIAVLKERLKADVCTIKDPLGKTTPNGTSAPEAAPGHKT